VLPLTADLGAALAAYLRVRPATTSGHVFVRIGVLEGDDLTPSVVRSAMRLAYQRAGLPATVTGTHRLRHTAATRLINAGASLKEVADVLGPCVAGYDRRPRQGQSCAPAPGRDALAGGGAMSAPADSFVALATRYVAERRALGLG
jgi:hypothetical protein